MQKNNLWGLLVAAASLGLSPAAHAVGLGNHQIRSSLGQPLKVSIEVISNTKGHIANSCFSLSKDTNTPEGIPFVTQGTLSIDGKGKNTHLTFTSSRPINDPVVKLAIETSCGQRSRREFTLILDPQGAHDGKEIPLPLAPGTVSPLNGTSPAKTSAVIPATSLPNAAIRPSVSKQATAVAPQQSKATHINESTASSSPSASHEESSSSKEPLPGSLNAQELEKLEKAIKSTASKKTDEKKKSKTVTNNDGLDEESASPRRQGLLSTIPDDAGDGGEPQLKVTGVSHSGSMSSHEVDPKLSLSTELGSLNTTSSGTLSAGESTPLSAKDKAEILAKVDSIVNAPLEQDLSNDQKAALNNHDDEISSYERVARQRAEEKLKEQLALASEKKSKRNLTIALLFGGGALLLLGYWGFRSREDQKNSKRTKKTSNTTARTKEDLAASLRSRSSDTSKHTPIEPITTEPTLSSHAILDKEPIKEEHTLVELPVSLDKEIDAHDTDAIADPAELSEISSIKEEENTAAATPLFVSAFTENDASEEHPHESPPLFLDDDNNPLIQAESGVHHTLFQPKIEINTAHSNPAQPFSTNTTVPTPHDNAEIEPMIADFALSTPLPHSEAMKEIPHNSHTEEQDTLHQGQTIVNQATQYLHAEKLDLVFSYLESSVEWLPSAPQPWLMLLRLYAEKNNSSDLFFRYRERFLNTYKNINVFSQEDLLHEPPSIDPKNPHAAALEQCAPHLLQSITQNWHNTETTQAQLKEVLLELLKKEPADTEKKEFSIAAAQEVLFLYNLISIKNPE